MRRSFFIPLLIMLIGCSEAPLTVQKVIQLDYASGSGITSLYKQVYVIGDDMNYLLVCDTNFNPTDTIYLQDSQLTRIPKDIKQDLEAATFNRIKKMPVIFLFGSGSDTNRNRGWIVNPFKKEKRSISLDTFYRRLTGEGIKEVNIEGAASFYAGFVLANRGNLGNPSNHLVFLPPGFWEKQSSAWLRVVKIGPGKEDGGFRGVSGLDYSKSSDRLIMSVSTEHTYDNVSDGAIGKSYLWIIENISAKSRMVALNPNKVIDLEEMDDRFKGQKVESVCILSETKKEMVLALACDNDDGKTTIFQIKLKK